MGNGIHPTNTSFTTFMKSNSKSFVLDGTCAEEVIACINNLRNTSSSGIGGISTKFLKLAKSTIAPILAKLFNKSMECGEYPDCLNISQIVPIPKCSSPSIPSQYRPISILPTVSKMIGGHFGSEAKVLLKKVELAQRKAVRHQAWLCTENDNSSYRNVCKMSVVSFALAVIFIKSIQNI